MRILGSDRTSVTAGFITISLISLSIAGDYGYQKAFACSCGRLEPQRYYEISDVIFVGKVTNIARDIPLEEGSHVTFAVIKSWKGVDTKTVTIHTGDGTSCGSFPFRGYDLEREYLVYGNTEFLETRVTLCGGTTPTEGPYANYDLKYLNDNFTSLELKAGHLRSVNIFPFLQILGGFLATAAAAFVLIRRS